MGVQVPSLDPSGPSWSKCRKVSLQDAHYTAGARNSLVIHNDLGPGAAPGGGTQSFDFHKL